MPMTAEVQRVVDPDLQASMKATVALHAAAAHGSGLAASVLSAADWLFAGTNDAKVREELTAKIATPELIALTRTWIKELRTTASNVSGTGACTVATALHLWSWTAKHLPERAAELADILVPLLAARCFALDAANSNSELQKDLSHAYAAHAAAQAGAACAELVYGYRRHLTWDAEGCATCFNADDLDGLEAYMPGIGCGARTSDVIEADGSHPIKEGPCAKFDGIEPFVRLRTRLDACLSGARIARDRAIAALQKDAR